MTESPAHRKTPPRPRSVLFTATLLPLHNGFTTVSQWFHNGFTMVLQLFHYCFTIHTVQTCTLSPQPSALSTQHSMHLRSRGSYCFPTASQPQGGGFSLRRSASQDQYPGSKGLFTTSSRPRSGLFTAAPLPLPAPQAHKVPTASQPLLACAASASRPKGPLLTSMKWR